MITIINLHEQHLPEGAIYVGRRNRTLPGSPLANPYKLAKESERQEVCDHYESWLRAWLEVPTSEQSQEIERLTELARQGDITLACWCSPKLCHADVVKRIIEGRLS